jgi:hypothetical protein
VDVCDEAACELGVYGEGEHVDAYIAFDALVFGEERKERGGDDAVRGLRRTY